MGQGSSVSGSPLSPPLPWEAPWGPVGSPSPSRCPTREGGQAGKRGQGGGCRAGGLLEPAPLLPPGVHLEGPFISREKRGAHPEAHLRSFEADAFQDLLATYGGLDNVRIVTLAPELGHSHEVIRALTALGICVSLGKGGGRPCLRGSAPAPRAESESGSPQGTRSLTWGLRRKPCRAGPPSSPTSSTPCCL